MNITKSALMVLTFMLIFSVFVAKVANLINVQIQDDDHERLELQKGQKPSKNGTLSDKLEHLIWFLQISDIHISKFHDHTRITELREFCDITLDAINPSVVVASGDLTDAKTKDHIGSRQYEREWQYYSSILKECKVEEKTKWLDIRGNHDNFNVPTINSKENYFTNYSIQGRNHPRSYMFQIRKDYDLYSFIAVDACLDPGPRRPFNFVGLLNDNEILHLKQLASDAVKNGTNYIIWFGHFPTSCILTSEVKGVRAVMGQHQEGLVYLCGHLHQLGGLVPHMYTLQQAGFLELELGDWKENRMYRLAAVDHGLFSFIDIRHRDWPIALITNPKHALYAIPGREPAHLIGSSSHIRVIAFSLSNIIEVNVKINNEDWNLCTHIEGPLYVSSWDPNLYSSGLHTIEVHVKDQMGRERIISQPFAVDNTRLQFGILARIALMTNISTVFQLFFGILLVLSIVPLCIFRYLHKLVKEAKMKKPLIKYRFFRNWIQKLWTLATVDRLFYPLVLYPIYLSFGPWSVGYILEDYIGVIFAWGIFVRGAYLPGSFTYAYGFLQMVIFQLPFTLILANCVHYRIKKQTDRIRKQRSLCKSLIFHCPFLVVLFLQMLLAYFFWLAYNTLAFLLSPLRSWSIIMAVLMWAQALTLPEKCTREANYVWAQKRKTDSTDEQEADEALKSLQLLRVSSLPACNTKRE